MAPEEPGSGTLMEPQIVVGIVAPMDVSGEASAELQVSVYPVMEQ